MISGVSFFQCSQFGPPNVQDFFILGLFPLFVANAFWIYGRPGFQGKRFFLTANGALITWLFFVALELFSLSPECKILWGMLAFLGIGLLPVVWFLFVYRYTSGETGPIKWWQWALMIAVPLISTAVALTSPWHGQFYMRATAPMSDAPGAPILYVHGPLFYATIAALYCFLIASFVLLAQGVKRTGGIARMLYVLLFAMTAMPTFANVGYIAFGINIAGFDPTPFLFSFVLVAYAALISLSSFFQITAVAKDLIFDTLPTAVVVLSHDGRIIASNQQAQTLLPTITGNAAMVWDVPALADLMTLAISGEKLTSAPEVRIADQVFEVRLTPLYDKRRTGSRQLMGYAFVFFEVTLRKHLQVSLTDALDASDAKISEILTESQRIADEILIDPLTGLLNRRSLQEEFDAMTASGAEEVFAVMVDIDHFKSINDQLGHGVGDQVLIAISTCLQRSFRTTDRVFRLGGEEFLILLHDIDLQSLYRRIARLRQDANVAGELLLPSDIKLRFSAGIATWPTDSVTLSDLCDTADQRLYTAKNSGRNRTTGPRAGTA